jgi:hypothetical protein
MCKSNNIYATGCLRRTSNAKFSRSNFVTKSDSSVSPLGRGVVAGGIEAIT